MVSKESRTVVSRQDLKHIGHIEEASVMLFDDINNKDSMGFIIIWRIMRKSTLGIYIMILYLII